MKATPFTRARNQIALLTVGIILAGTTALSSPAQAHQNPASQVATKATAVSLAEGPGSTRQQANGWCTYSNWGGHFYCKSQYAYRLPNGYLQVFVIGTNRQVYSRWDSGSGVSSWTSLGGQCISPGNHSVDMWYWDGWFFQIACVGTNNYDYVNTRYADGGWSGWEGPYDLPW